MPTKKPLSQPSSDSGRKRAMASPARGEYPSAGSRSRGSKTSTTMLIAEKELRQRWDRPPRFSRKIRIPHRVAPTAARKTRKLRNNRNSETPTPSCFRSDLTLARLTPGLLQRLPLLHHQLVRDVVLVNVADVLDRHRPHTLRHHQLNVAKPLVRIQSLRRCFLAQLRDAIRARSCRPRKSAAGGSSDQSSGR